jgi:hypothetical protein
MLITLLFLVIAGYLRPTPDSYPLGLLIQQVYRVQPILETSVIVNSKQTIRTS